MSFVQFQSKVLASLMYVVHRPGKFILRSSILRGCHHHHQHETKKLYERMAISHPPFWPFSHRDFHSKRLIPPKVLYLTCVRDKSENLKQQNPNGEFSKWWRCQERFQGHPLSDGPSPVRHAIAHLFCRLPALATWRDTYGSEQAQQRTPSSIMAELMISFNWSMKLMVVLDNSFIVSCVPSFKILLESQAFQR